MAIRDYIERYAFPLKIQDLLQSYETIFKETNQLINIASIRFDKAVRARADADAEKNSEESKKEEAEKVKMSLTNVSEAISEKKSELDNNIRQFRYDVEKQTVDIKTVMEFAIKDAKKTAKDNAKKEAVKSDIKKIVDRAIKDSHAKVETYFSESRGQTQKLESEIRSFFQKIRTVIDFGDDFKIDNTTDFQSINTDSISKIENTGHYIRNPELNEGFFLWRPFKNLFVEKRIWKNDGINLEELDRTLTDIRIEFAADIDATFNQALTKLTTASGKLKDNLDKLEKKINEYADRLKAMSINIERMTADTTEKANLEQKLYEFKQLLSIVQNYTYFDEISEE